MPDADRDQQREIPEETEGTPVFPPGTSETHRRRLLKAMGGGSTVAIAGCLGLGSDDEAFFELSELSPAAAEVAPGEEVEMTATIENTGDETATKTVEARLDGDALDRQQVELSGGGRDGLSYTFEAPDEIGEYTHSFWTEDDEESGTLTVTDEPTGAFFGVSLDVEDTVQYSGELAVAGTVENTGQEGGTQTVTLSVDDEEVDSQEVELEPGETAEIGGTAPSDPPGGTHDVVIESDNDTASVTVQIGPPSYPDIDTMVPDVAPKELVKPIEVQVAYNDEEVMFNFEWEQPDPGGWLHDMIYYDGDAGEWRRLSDWDPWVLDEDYGFPDHHEGYYEDRLSWFWHDGTLQTDDGNRPFEQYGGWMTVMEGVRTLAGEASQEEVDDHPYFGTEGRDEGDMRKFIPQSRNGEWWEHDWDDPKPADELDQMLEDGRYIDFPFWRAHRSNPMGYGTNHHVLAYREGNQSGDRTFFSQDWGPEDGPEYMFDPDIVDGGAIDRNEVVDEDGNPLDTMPDQQEYDQYALISEGENENMVEFDPEVAEWDGAMVPRRPLQMPSESGASWRADGIWENETWNVEMRRELDTGYIDDMPVEEGETYTFSPALHHGVSQRWHWVAYPLKLAMGEDAELDWYGEDTELGTSVIRAQRVDGEPNWDEIETYTIPLMFPGMTDWTWLTSGEHPRVDEIRNAEINIWDHHDESPEDFAQRMIELEEMMAPRK